MPCRVGIHLMALLSIEVARLEQSCAKPDRRLVCNSRIFDVEVEMHLLESTVRPLRRDVIGRELHADVPLAGRTDDAVELVVTEDLPAEDPCPEPALGVQVGRVEYDYLTNHVHCPNLARAVVARSRMQDTEFHEVRRATDRRIRAHETSRGCPRMWMCNERLSPSGQRSTTCDAQATHSATVT